MTFFRERNKIQKEYSGYEEASEPLRQRLAAIIEERSGYSIGLGNEDFYLYRGELDHQVKIRTNWDCLGAILRGTYDEVFEAVEIFLNLVIHKLRESEGEEMVNEVVVIFRSAGSVYTVNKRGQVVLSIPEETAKNIAGTEEGLGSKSGEALDFFKRALHDLLSRGRTANDIVKDFAISMEDYIKAISGKKDYGEALKALRARGVIAATQQGVLDKLYAYRGDAHGVAHSGNTEEPSTVDAVWFLETFVAQVKMIEAKLKLG